jgi:hypothetical protein
MTQLLDDLDVERWAQIYQGNHIDRRLPGLTFAQFVVNPNAYLIMAIFRESQPIADDDSAPEFFPLLPAQEQVALEQVWREGLAEACAPGERSFGATTEALLPAQAVHRGDHYIEPLHHRSWPR